MKSFIATNLRASLPESLGLRGRQTVYVNFVINIEGSIERLSIGGNSAHPSLIDEVERVIELLPRMLPGKQRGIEVAVPYSTPITFGTKTASTISFERRSTEEIRRQDSIRILAYQKSVEEKEVTTLSKSEISSYAFSSTTLGWKNLDRYVRSSFNMKIKVKEHGGARVKLVFKKYRSIIRGRTYADGLDFGFVPPDEEVLLIAIRKLQDKLYLATKELKTEKGLEFDLDYKEMSLKEIRKEVERITSFDY